MPTGHSPVPIRTLRHPKGPAHKQALFLGVRRAGMTGLTPRRAEREVIA